jgi:hypothetical protein
LHRDADRVVLKNYKGDIFVYREAHNGEAKPEVSIPIEIVEKENGSNGNGSNGNGSNGSNGNGSNGSSKKPKNYKEKVEVTELATSNN